MKTKSALFISILNKQNKPRELFFPARLPSDLGSQRAFESQQGGNISSLWVGRSRTQHLYRHSIFACVSSPKIVHPTAIGWHYIRTIFQDGEKNMYYTCVQRLRQTVELEAFNFKFFTALYLAKYKHIATPFCFVFSLLPSSLSSLKWIGGYKCWFRTWQCCQVKVDTFQWRVKYTSTEASTHIHTRRNLWGTVASFLNFFFSCPK